MRFGGDFEILALMVIEVQIKTKKTSKGLEEFDYREVNVKS